MRIFANLFLLLFLADGAVSVLDEVVSLFFTSPALSGYRNILANLVVIMAALLYLSLGIDRRLPKRIFLPPVIFVLFCPLSLALFPSLAGNHGFEFLLAAAQLLLFLLPLHHIRKMNRGRPGLTLPNELFDAPFFSLRNSLIFGAANLVAIPLVLGLVVFSSVGSAMAKNTSGFMRLSPGGIYMAEKVYTRGKQTVRLVAMIHMGEKKYYQELSGSVSSGRTVVLAEGVSDVNDVLPNKLDYGNVADYLGLTLQQENMHFKGRLVEPEELDKPKPKGKRRSEAASDAGEVDIVRADVDVSSFRPPTLQFLDALGKQMREHRSVAKALLASNAWAEKYVTPEMQKVIMDDILYRRNKEVIGHLRKVLPLYDTVVIPWGALHMPEIEAEVLRQGFRLKEVRERESIDFGKILRQKG